MSKMDISSDKLEVIVRVSYKPCYRRMVNIRDKAKVRSIFEDLRDKFGIDV